MLYHFGISAKENGAYQVSHWSNDAVSGGKSREVVPASLTVRKHVVQAGEVTGSVFDAKDTVQINSKVIATISGPEGDEHNFTTIGG